jgi:hypothetical protein
LLQAKRAGLVTTNPARSIFRAHFARFSRYFRFSTNFKYFLENPQDSSFSMITTGRREFSGRHDGGGAQTALFFCARYTPFSVVPSHQIRRKFPSNIDPQVVLSLSSALC